MELQLLKTNSTGYEDSSHNTNHFVCTEYADSQDLWSSPSSLSHNSCVELGTFDNGLISLSPESHFQPFQNPNSSNNQLSQDDSIESSYNEPKTPFTDFSTPEQSNNATIPCVNSRSAFVEWRSYRPPLNSLQPTKSKSLHKCCIRFLNCIKGHKTSSLNTKHGGKPRLNVNHKIPEKLAIRHAEAERKRRGEMKNIYFALRKLLPEYAKKSKATVLIQTLDYINHLKRRVELLEKRNEELEEFLRTHTIAID